MYLQEEIQTQHNFSEIVGNSPALLRRSVRSSGWRRRNRPCSSRARPARARSSSRAPSTSAARGGTSAGQSELRRDPPALVESELFGHVKGAFTGAHREARRPVRAGRRRHALPRRDRRAAARRCRSSCCACCRSSEFEPVGSSADRRVDVRVIAATNRDLEATVDAGTFRADLSIASTSSRSRCRRCASAADDIPLLVGLLPAGSPSGSASRFKAFTAAQPAIVCVTTPGPATCASSRTSSSAPRFWLRVRSSISSGAPAGKSRHAGCHSTAHPTLEELERQHILEVVRQTNWTIEGQKGAAVILGLTEHAPQPDEEARHHENQPRYLVAAIFRSGR